MKLNPMFSRINKFIIIIFSIILRIFDALNFIISIILVIPLFS